MRPEICATGNIVVSLSDVLRIIDFESRYQKEQLEDDCAYNALQTVREHIACLQRWSIDYAYSRGVMQKVFPFCAPPEHYISVERDKLIKGHIDRIVDYLIVNKIIEIHREAESSGLCDGITVSLLFATKLVNPPDFDALRDRGSKDENENG